MKKTEQVDYGNVPIKKLPPGKAYGADDLTRWSLNRTLGRAGSGSPDTTAVTLVCQKCKGTSQIIGGKRKRDLGSFSVCRHCGKKAAKVVKSKKIRS